MGNSASSGSSHVEVSVSLTTKLGDVNRSWSWVGGHSGWKPQFSVELRDFSVTLSLEDASLTFNLPDGIMGFVSGPLTITLDAGGDNWACKKAFISKAKTLKETELEEAAASELRRRPPPLKRCEISNSSTSEWKTVVKDLKMQHRITVTGSVDGETKVESRRCWFKEGEHPVKVVLAKVELEVEVCVKLKGELKPPPESGGDKKSVLEAWTELMVSAVVLLAFLKFNPYRTSM